MPASPARQKALRPQRSGGRHDAGYVRKEYIPESVAAIGEATRLLLEDPRDGSWHEWAPRVGAVLCAAEEEGTLYLLRPIGDAGKPRTRGRALHVEGLYERFMHREADAFYNCFVELAVQPVFKANVILIRYRSDKDMDEEYGETRRRRRPVEYEHAFPAPNYPELWGIGSDQFIIAGDFAVREEGITETEAA